MMLHIAPPPPRLAPFIEALFHVQGISDDSTGVRLPKRGAELVFALAGHYTVVAAPHDVGATYTTAWITGMCTVPVTLRTEGRSAMVGARFTPWGARAFVSVQQAALRDRSLLLESLWGEAEVARVRNELQSALDAAAACDVLASALLDRLPATHRTPAAVVRACTLLLEGRGRARIAALAAAAGISEQRLRSQFREHVGVSPKMLARLIAHDEAIAQLNDLPSGRLAAAAHGLGFADQSHFNRDFTALSGLTPGEYLALRGPPGSRSPFAHFLTLPHA